MSKAAGPELQEQLKEKTSGKQFGEGDIVHTGPGNLNCRHVIHCVCCPWKGNLKEEQVRLIIRWATFMLFFVALLLYHFPRLEMTRRNVFRFLFPRKFVYLSKI